jgi:hypothetical protein
MTGPDQEEQRSSDVTDRPASDAAPTAAGDAGEPDRQRSSDHAPPNPDRGGGLTLRRSALIVLVLAIIAAIAFAYIRGGLTYPLQPPPGTVAAGARASATAPTDASGPGVPEATASQPAASALPATSLAPLPSPSVAPAPTDTPRPTPSPQATPRSDRYDVLRPCGDAPRCWIYIVRSGDNLVSIAHWFGVSLDTVHAMNPWTLTVGLRAGQDLRLPPPTR